MCNEIFAIKCLIAIMQLSINTRQTPVPTHSTDKQAKLLKNCRDQNDTKLHRVYKIIFTSKALLCMVDIAQYKE